MSKNKQVFVFIWTLFFAYFGYTFIVAPNSDGNHYRVTFLEIRDWVHLQGLSFPDLLSKIYDYYPDPYVPIASYLVALFTDDWHVLFSVYGLVLGYFFSENIYSILKSKNLIENKNNRMLAVLGMVFMIFLVPIWEINGVRMWTACHFFIYNLYRYTQTGNGKYLLGFSLAGFFHSSFMLAPAIALTYFVFNKVPFNLRLALVLTVVLLKQSGTMINPQFEKIEGTGALAQKFNTYNNEDYLKGFEEGPNETVVDNTSWFVTWNGLYLTLTSSIIVILAVFKLYQLRRFDEIHEGEHARLIGIFLALTFISYLMSLHPSPSASRFIRVAGVFSAIALAQIIGIWEYLLNKSEKGVVIYPMLYLILFILVVQTRFGFENFNTVAFFGNPLYAVYQEEPKPLITVYHSIFGVYGAR